MMSKRERMFDVGIGLVFAAVTGLIAKHFYNPSYVTVQLTAAVLVPVAGFFGFMAYDSLKEGLTGKRD